MMNGARPERRIPPTAGVLAVAVALLLPLGAEAQSGTTTGSVGRTFFGSGASSSAGRAAPSPPSATKLPPVRPDRSRDRDRATVPINAHTLANGTANRPLPRERDRPRRRTRFLPSLPPVVVLNQQVTVVNEIVAGGAEGRSGRRPEPAGERPSDAPPAPGNGTPGAADAPSGEPSSGNVRAAPRVPPPSRTPTERPREAPDADACVSVWITTAGGIEWRHRVAFEDLGVSAVSEAASLLQGRLRRGEPLAIESVDGSFRVPAPLVESLVVGSCRPSTVD